MNIRCIDAVELTNSQIADILRHYSTMPLGMADRRLFMKIQVLFWLLGAIDGHAKNFIIFLMPGGDYSLAPVYDVMSAYPHSCETAD